MKMMASEHDEMMASEHDEARASYLRIVNAINGYDDIENVTVVAVVVSGSLGNAFGKLGLGFPDLTLKTKHDRAGWDLELEVT